MKTSDNGFLIYGQILLGYLGVTPKMQPTLAKLDSNFQILLIKHFGPNYSIYDTFENIEPTADGNYIMAGERGPYDYVSEPYRGGWLHKVSPEGDSLWSRLIFPPVPLVPTNVPYFGGVGVLSSGSIVAAGGATEGNQRYCWLVKVTQDGCLDTLLCQVSAREPEVQMEKESVKIYPNPASELLHVEMPDYLLGAAILLFNAQGQVVCQSPPNHAGLHSLPVSQLPNGIYFLEVQANHQSVVRQKFVVLH